jgi:hypothetical protein
MLAGLLSYNEMNFGTKEDEFNNKHDGKKKKCSVTRHDIIFEIITSLQGTTASAVERK